MMSNNLKKLIFGLAALVLAFGLVFTMSAFKPKKGEMIHFRYNSSATTDEAYREITNWEPTEEPEDCPGSGKVCVLQIDENLLSGNGTPLEQLEEYFDSLTGTDEVKDFVEDPQNILYEKS
ncbi:hypothetical protein [Pedobacter sp. UBA4863]|uniref:hypothetical protein n=1 Tax=Pedobacter sp. UBA4863 TaxID=1947060 RepID=UPI0025DC8028|nr:hypothetical protein [Pedobacter sp. UBA4863]